MAVSETGVSIWEAFDAGEPCERDAREILLRQLPNDAALLVYFQDAVSVAGGQERVAVFQATRAKGLVSKTLWAVSALGGTVE